MDGTLTHAIHDFDEIREQLNLPAGKPILESIANLPTSDAKKTTKALNDLEMEIASQATQQPGAAQLLDFLKSSGSNIGILTRNGKDIAHATLRACGLDHYFAQPHIISRDCAIPKPDPAGLIMLLSRWQVQAQSAVMVGDYLFDLEAGQRAGACTVHLATDGQYHWPEHTSVGVQSLAELLSLLDSG